MENQIYNIVFEDGSEFKGGNMEYPGWNKCPRDKKISALELCIPNGDGKIVLDEYEEYNFFIGASKFIQGGSVRISHMYGLGSRRGIVTSCRITLASSDGNKHKVGDITIRKFPRGKEGLGRTSTSGWKDGTLEKKE